MKFINLITKHTRDSINAMLDSMDKVYIDEITALYAKFEHVEYLTTDGYVGMYAAVSDVMIEKLLIEYVKCGVDFTYSDITKKVLFGFNPQVVNPCIQIQLDMIVKEFVDENINSDIILDKINEIGINSLTEKDKLILKTS